ncbi:hypothetical protein CRE_18022 [Caenorhabditis remanei]|uniref:Uncharacterized protein n=1 Tax=Caenorhabditis remanei TaxID=31234 RepID=E3MTU0_CAERE|nr:hypothetical protein CRE_18022 [Caenorhabditis remanei]
MTTSIDLYYETVWKSKCSSNEKSFLASWQGLSLFSHSMLVVFLPFYAFTTYCILTKTPKTMDSVKFVLLNAHCWSCYCDILACSLITPYFFFPTMCGFPVGLLRVLGVPTSAQTFIGIVSLLFMGISVVALFENRSSCIPSNRFRITKKRSRFLYYLFNCTVIIAYIIPPFCYIPEQESAKLFILQTIPCPTEEFFYAEVFVWTIDKFWNNYIWMATGSIVLIILSQGLFYAICCIYYLYFSTAVIISTKTQKYQRSFFLGTVAQVVVPFIFLVIPVATGISSIYFDYYNQVLNNYCVLFLSLHGFAATIIITLVHHPYRTFLIKVIAFYRSSDQTSLTFHLLISILRLPASDLKCLSLRFHLPKNETNAMTTSTDVYYETEWKSKCSSNEKSFLASWQGLSLFSHSMLVVFLPFYAFTTYCILKKTPRTMDSVKFVLLNAHCWCCYCDILICSLITPYFFFPTISGFPVGLLRVLGVPTSVQVFIGIVSCLFMGTSLVALFENRSSCIPSNRFRITKKRSRFLYYLFNCTVIIGYLIPPFCNIPEQESAKLFLLQVCVLVDKMLRLIVRSRQFLAPLKSSSTPKSLYGPLTNFGITIYGWLQGSMVLIILLQVLFYSICCLYYLYISTAAMISLKTRKYQRSFFLGTIAQAVVPLIFLVIPVASGI